MGRYYGVAPWEYEKLRIGEREAIIADMKQHLESGILERL